MIESIEAYYDAAPRSGAQAETVGAFTLFVSRGAWSYYARPALGLDRRITPADVADLRARQRELDVAQEIEWQPALTPSLEDACLAAGMVVYRFRLLVHGGSPTPRDDVRPDDIRLNVASDEVAPCLSVQQQGFGGPAEVDTDTVEHVARRISTGASRLAAAFVGDRPVCVGIHQPVDEVSEVVGVATLAEFRRQGWAGAVTHALVADARSLGVGTVFLSAADDSVARVYERVGFREVGVVCAAEPAN